MDQTRWKTFTLSRYFCRASRHWRRRVWGIPNDRASHQFLLHPLNSRHVVVKNGLLAATIPFDGYARPILFNDGALIGLIVLPAYAVERLEKSGLVAGHAPDFRVTTRSTRFISLWPEELSWPSSYLMVTYLI